METQIFWIPAFAGMTWVAFAGMTWGAFTGMTRVAFAGMTRGPELNSGRSGGGSSSRS